MYAYACGADNGNDPTHCNDNWQFNGTPTWSAMYSGGYYEIGRYVWPYQTSGVTQNDWVCKVQIDVFNGGQLLDYVVWRDPQRCGSTPPPATPFYQTVSPVGGNTISSLYPTFTWNSNTTGIQYNNICVGTSSVDNPCIYGPALSARSFTATQALAPSTRYYWLIYGCKPSCSGGGISSGWATFITPAVPGTLYVSTTPVSGGIYVDGSYVGSGSWSGSYYTSGHTVSFGGVGGYNTPGAQSVTVYNGQTTYVTGTYTVQNGTLSINTTPVGGAIYVNGGYWGTGSASSVLSPGTYTVSFGAVANYNTPAAQSATVYAGQTTNITGTYAIQNGTLTVNTSPSGGGVYVNGSYWGAAPQGRSIAPGTYTVTFGAITNYNTPAAQYPVVYSNQTTTVTGTYTIQSGTLTVNTSPSGGGVYVNGTYWGIAPQSRALTPGTYTVTFGTLTNYNTPVSQSATVYANQTTTITGTYVAQPGTLTINTAPAGGGVYVNGSSWGAASQSRSLSPGTYTVTFGALTYYNAPAAQSPVVYSNQTTTVTGTYTPTPLSAPSLTCAGTAQTTANCSWGAVIGATRYFFQAGTGSASSGNLASNPNASSPTNFTGLACGTTYYARVRAENGVTVSPWTSDIPFTTSVCTGTVTVGVSGVASAPFTYNGTPGTAPTTLTLSVGPYTFSFGSVAGYLLTGITPSANITVSNGGTSTVIGNYTATSTLTINLINDVNGNGIVDPGDNNVGVPLHVICSPSGSADCISPLTITGSRNLTLLQGGGGYTFTYDINDSTNVAAGYRFVTGNRKDTAYGPPPFVTQTITMDASNHTIDFLVTTNSPAWIQAWDGDVYSGYKANPSQPGIKITVNSQAGSVGYSPVFIHESLGGLGGGLAMASAGSYGVDCNTAASPLIKCSETRNWVIGTYPPPQPTWPSVIDGVTTCNPADNVCYLSGSLTVSSGNIGTYSGAGTWANKVVIVNGDLTFDATGIPGAGRQVSAYFVVKGHTKFVNVSSSSNPWIINGGLASQNDPSGIDFSYSLDDNKTPAVVFKYNPAILLNSTPLSQATYIWREVTAL